MEQFDDMYTDLIMEHSMNSPNKKNIDSPTCSLKGHNHNCGDEIELEVKLNDDKIEDWSWLCYFPKFNIYNDRHIARENTNRSKKYYYYIFKNDKTRKFNK